MKFILVLFIAINTLFANENLVSIYDNIVMKNIDNATNVSIALEKKLEQGDLSSVQAEFKALVKAWKSVEAFYILGDLNEDYLDTPRYIDTFHQGNEDIKEQLDLIIKQTEDLSIALYKNSHKTINALEYILYKQDINNKRVKDIALIIIKKIHENLKEIQNGYIESKSLFLKDEQKANGIMLNSLIENSYKLKEWRIGDSAGLSRKYKGKPDNRRAEYAISKNSIVAIEAILNTHMQVLGKQAYKNFGGMIRSYAVNEELDNAIKYLNSSLLASKSIVNDDFSSAKPLYKSAKKLHMTYYISLIGKLKITSKILDADGD